IANGGDPTAAQPGSALHAYERADIPMLHIGGWYDVFLNGTLRNFDSMRRLGRPGQRLLIGPWTHGNVSAVQGELDFGFAASGALVDLQFDLMTYQLTFFDRWLKELPNGWENGPAIKYFVMGANVWKGAETWPPAGVTEQRWYLHSDGRANGGADGGSLSVELPRSESADGYEYDPARPVPTLGGATLMHPLFKAGPRDQRPIEQRDDMLVYTSAPLETPLEIAGPVRVTLHVATDAPDTDFVARLVDVYPDGRAMTVTDGITRMRFRNGRYAPAEALVADQVYQVEIDLWSTALVVLPGHRLRVDVTSSSFPRWERNLNTSADSATTTAMRPARQTVLHDADHPSHLAVSVVPNS
ncbi:MAG: CocE/NonD family hydrolase, partial [Ktedonobacterales bacterium]